MKLLALQHMAVPIHCAGGETTVHAAFRAMVKRGHEVRVICRPHSSEIQFDDYEFEGVTVVRPPRVHEKGHNPEIQEQEWIRRYAERFDPDLLITHLDLTTMAMQLSLDIQKPLAHFFHNTFSIPVFNVQPHKCQLAIFNSKWVSEFSKWEGRQIIIHPVVEPDKYRCERGDKIAFINPTPNKGADTFYALAEALPDLPFLTVKSVYGEQIAAPNINPDLHPNVETMEHVADAREYLRKTKIVLMPSDYESYGRVAVEAACAGIPAIVHPTEGLLEALDAETPDWLLEFTRTRADDYKNKRHTPTPEPLKGGFVSGAGIFCDRNDTESWKAQVERLMADEVYYRSRSDAALKLAASLDPESEYDRLENAMLVTAETWQRGDKSMKMWTSDRRLYKSRDGARIKENMEDGDSLYAIPGQQIPEEIAIQFGFVTPQKQAVTVTPDPVDDAVQWAKDGHDRAAALDAKAMESPDENKAIEAPAENKAKPRKKKAA